MKKREARDIFSIFEDIDKLFDEDFDLEGIEGGYSNRFPKFKYPFAEMVEIGSPFSETVSSTPSKPTAFKYSNSSENALPF